jgi:hypothetical protein
LGKLLTQETFIADLTTGIYYINSIDSSYGLWLDDSVWTSIDNGIAIVSYIEEINCYKWIIIGRDNGWNDIF